MASAQFYNLIRTYLDYDRLHQASGAWLDYRLSLASRKPHLRHYPPAVMLEPTNHCNLQCPMCPSGNGTLTRERGFMPWERYQKIIDNIYKKVGLLILWNQGEPFLHPNFYDMLDYANHKKLFTMISTNASLPLDLKRLHQAKPGKLIISLDGISEATYNSYRINGDHKQVLENLRAMSQIPSLRAALVWQFIVMRQNEHEVAQAMDIARELKIRLELKTVQIYHPDEIPFLPSNPSYSRYKIKGGEFRIKTDLLNRCRRLWTQPVINQDGEFSICCYDKDLAIPIGNIDTHSFEDLWFGERMNRMRQQILTDRKQLPICQNCGEGIVQRIKT